MATDPTRSTSVFGFRDTELFALGREVGAHHLVTVIGPPGIGKSALARAFARQNQKKQRGAGVKAEGGAIICRLEAARTSVDVAHEVARALGLVTTAGGDSSAAALGERVGRTLALRRRVVVVLDDVDRCKTALTKLLPLWTREAPSASFVVTARGRLGLAGERRLEVPALDVPAAREKNTSAIASSNAVEMFARYAAIARPGFRITDTNARTVATIVRKLEGVPLAIELCASRMVALSERDIAELLAERLDLLEDDQRSIRSAFALSWDDLDDEDARLLAACSIFENGFTLDAATFVVTESTTAKDRVRVAKSLERLVEGSLVHLVDDVSVERRYSISETLRAFAKEKLVELGASAEAERRHTRFFTTGFAKDKAVSVDALALDRKNLEKAVDRAFKANDFDAASGAILALAPVALARGPLAAFIDRLTKVIDNGAASDSRRAELLLHRAIARLFQGKRDVAFDDFRESAAAASDPRTRAIATGKVALITAFRGDVETGLALFDDALAAAEKSDDKTLGLLRKDRGNLLSEAGRNDEAIVELGRARKYLHAAGELREEGVVLLMLGSRFVDEGQIDPARRDCTAALSLLRQAGDRRSEAWALGNLSLADAEEGDTSSARRHLDVALGLIREVGDEQTEGLLLGFLGNVALEQGLLVDAESAYRDAIVRLSRAGDHGSEGLVTAAAAVVEHRLGRHPSARDGIERARALAKRDGRLGRRDAVEILASIIEGKPPPHCEHLVEEVRFARRVASERSSKSTTKKRPAVRAESSPTTLVIANDGSWVRLESGDVAKLGAGRPVARVMHQLALERFRHPGRPVAPHSLVRAGWPNERVLPAAAKNRLHVTIARLRRLVGETTLLHDGEGYFLDPSKHARLAEPTETA